MIAAPRRIRRASRLTGPGERDGEEHRDHDPGDRLPQQADEHDRPDDRQDDQDHADDRAPELELIVARVRGQQADAGRWLRRGRHAAARTRARPSRFDGGRSFPAGAPVKRLRAWRRCSRSTSGPAGRRSRSSICDGGRARRARSSRSRCCSARRRRRAAARGLVERDRRRGAAPGRSSSRRRDVRAVAVTGQWAGTVAVGDDGEPLRRRDDLARQPRRRAGAARSRAAARAASPGYDAAQARALDPADRRRAVARRAATRSATSSWLRDQRPGDLRGRATASSSRSTGSKLQAHRRPRGRRYDTATLHWVTDTRDPLESRYDDAAAGAGRARRATSSPSCGPSASVARARSTRGGAGGARRRPHGVPVVTRDAGHDVAPPSAPARSATTRRTSTSAPRRGSRATCPYKRTDPLHAIAVAARRAARALPRLVPSSRPRARRSRCVRDRWLAGTPGADAATPRSPTSRRRRRPAAAACSSALAQRRAHAGRRPPRARRLAQPQRSTRRAPQLVRAVLEGVALNARWMQRAGRALLQARGSTRSRSSAAARCRRCGRRSSPTCCGREIRASRRPGPRERARRRVPGAGSRSASCAPRTSRRASRTVAERSRPTRPRATLYDGALPRSSSRSTRRRSRSTAV